MPLGVGKVNTKSYKIVGFYVNAGTQTPNGIYVSKSLYDSLAIYGKEVTKYEREDDAIYSDVYLSYDHSTSSFLNVYDKCGMDNVDSTSDIYYEIDSSLLSSVAMVNAMADVLSNVFLGVGITFAVFASLLLFNFISMSISNKRKEIGILRAVGARGIDVFKIFFAEAGIISLICLILSTIASALICPAINGILYTSMGLEVTLFVFGIISFLMMALIALVVAIISTFLPVFFAARKKPVESIRAL